MATDLEQRNRELMALIEVGTTLAATLEPSVLLRQVANTALELLEADRASLMLLNDEADAFTVAAAAGWESDGLEGMETPADQGIAGYVAERGQPVLLNAGSAEGPAHLLNREAIRSGVCVPIVTGTELLGVLSATNTRGNRRFTEHDKELLLFLAGQAAVALHNARLYQDSVQAFERLKHTQERMLQAEKLKAVGELSAGVAHDFSNLLGGILGHAQLMLRDIDDPRQVARLRHIEQAARDGAETVARILEFTRQQAHRPFERVDLNAVVRDSIAMSRPRWENQTRVYGTPLDVTLDLGDIPAVEGHPAKLREVLTNILLNAVDALPEGGSIDIRTWAEAGDVYVTVRDTGHGMTDEVQSRIFDPFFSTKGTLGTGLGLSVAYGIVGQHGGHITVDSAPGRGSTFTLCFPEAEGASERMKILVVEDEAAMRSMLVDLLDGLGYEVTEAADGLAGWEAFQACAPDLVITDVSMPRLKGTDLLARVKRESPDTPVVVITGYASLKMAVDAVRMGAYSYVQKPFDIDEIQRIVGAALERTRLLDDNKYLRQQLRLRYNFDARIGSNRGVQEAYVMAARAAGSSASILILGETGTGKEYLARTIHYQSPRAEKPFLKVSCAALPETLLESELFGHEKGAFTHALNRRAGRFELADGGTLLLDEIGDISLSTQIKLLRVLQEKEFERLGGTETLKSDVRILAATNRNLAKAVEDGSFRSDLLYRLNVITLHLPPLRERGDDLMEYAAFFLERANTEAGKAVRGFTDEAVAAMRAYPWPGNIRELENAVQRAVILTLGDAIRPEDLLLPKDPIGMPAAKSRRFRTLREAQKDHAAAALAEAGGDETTAARLLDVTVEELRSLRGT